MKTKRPKNPYGVKPKTKSSKLDQLLTEVVGIQNQLDMVKPLYGRMEQLIDQVRALTKSSKSMRVRLSGQESGQNVNAITEYLVHLTDNFKKKNTQFKASAFRRFEFKIVRVK